MMNYLLLGLSVLLSSMSQIWQKMAADILKEDESLSKLAGPLLHRALRVLRIKETWFALLSLSGSMLLWLWVLYGMDVSKAFPVISMSIVIVMLISRWKFEESVSVRRWFGAVLITIGVCLVASS
jgi:undecaprenyl phosphate-alpha-L-ara4N flippase subunit ArnE